MKSEIKIIKVGENTVSLFIDEELIGYIGPFHSFLRDAVLKENSIPKEYILNNIKEYITFEPKI